VTAVSVQAVSPVVAYRLPLRPMRYETAPMSSLEGCHDRTIRTGSLAPEPTAPLGAVGGMKSVLGRPPLSASQSTLPALASAIA
jgi:hypothetical protein